MKKFFAWVAVSAVTLSCLLFVPLNVYAETFEEPQYPDETVIDAHDFWDYVYLPILQFYSPSLTYNPYYHDYYYYDALTVDGLESITEMTKDIVRTQIEYGQGDYLRGFEDGKIAGMAGDFKIKDMIFSIIDAPFKIVREALNFEIFGVEVSSLVLGLLSMVLVIFVIRRIKG